MAHTINSTVRLPMLIRLEVKQSGSPTSLMTSTISGACRIKLPRVSFWFQISWKLREMSTASWRSSLPIFTLCIVFPPPWLPPGTALQGG